MNIIESIYQNTLRTSFNCLTRYKPWYKNYLLLKSTQWLSEDKLMQMQLEKIKALLVYSYAHVPYYKELFDSCGLDVRNIKELNDLLSIPLLTKKLIQQNLEKLRSSTYPLSKVKIGHTGGSTGHPLKYYHSKEYLDFSDRAVLFGIWEISGYQVGKRIVFVWGADVDARKHTTPFEKLKDRYIRNLLWINTFDLDRERILNYAKKLASFQPQFLVGYVSSLAMMAEVVKSLGITKIRPQAIVSSSEMLTEDSRRLIEATFECPIFNRYGCREVGEIAVECSQHKGLHVFMESNYVEIINKEGKTAKPGEVGNIVVTNLHNLAMPFIRYEVGDLGIPSARKCPCRRGRVLIEKIIGRQCDIITSPSGKFIHGEFFTHLFYGIEAVAQFQVAQKTLADLDIKIVPDKDFDKERVIKSLRKAIHKYGDEKFNVNFHICDRIAPPSSGKRMFTISELPIEWKRQ